MSRSSDQRLRDVQEAVTANRHGSASLRTGPSTKHNEISRTRLA
jgi:hypothetical protein